MKVSEVIAELNRMQDKFGNLEVRIQWSDGGGCYLGDGCLTKDSFTIWKNEEYSDEAEPYILLEGMND